MIEDVFPSPFVPVEQTKKREFIGLPFRFFLRPKLVGGLSAFSARPFFVYAANISLNSLFHMDAHLQQG